MQSSWSITPTGRAALAWDPHHVSDEMVDAAWAEYELIRDARLSQLERNVELARERVAELRRQAEAVNALN